MVSKNVEIAQNGFHNPRIVQTNPKKVELALLFIEMSAETGGRERNVCRNRWARAKCLQKQVGRVAEGSAAISPDSELACGAGDDGRQDFQQGIDLGFGVSKPESEP